MGLEELYGYTVKYAQIHKLDLADVHPMYKDELIEGREYRGMARDTVFATWTGKCFTYKRNKYGKKHTERLSHFEDDDYDFFIPFDLMG